jgi:hypothetical protein
MPRAATLVLLVTGVDASTADGSRTVADRLPGGCLMSAGWPAASEPAAYTVPPGATLTLVTELTGADRETVVHVEPDLSCRVPSPRLPPAAMSIPSVVTASAL